MPKSGDISNLQLLGPCWTCQRTLQVKGTTDEFNGGTQRSTAFALHLPSPPRLHTLHAHPPCTPSMNASIASQSYLRDTLNIHVFCETGFVRWRSFGNRRQAFRSLLIMSQALFRGGPRLLHRCLRRLRSPGSRHEPPPRGPDTADFGRRRSEPRLYLPSDPKGALSYCEREHANRYMSFFGHLGLGDTSETDGVILGNRIFSHNENGVRYCTSWASLVTRTVPPKRIPTTRNSSEQKASL